MPERGESSRPQGMTDELENEEMHIKVRKLDVQSIKPHRILLLLGKRGSGKTKLLIDLLSNMRDRFDFALAMCPTVECCDLLKQHMPTCCVYERYVQSKVDALVKMASECAAGNKPRSFLLILDDVLYDKGICRTQSFRYLFYNGRHAKVCVALCCQYAIDLPPELRAQIDVIFTMKENTIQNRLKLYNMFFGVFGTFEDFSAVLDRCTQNYETLVLDNTKQTTDISDCIFWYKAELDHDDFKLGKAVFYELEDRHQRAEALVLQFDEETLRGGKAGGRGRPKLLVSKEGGVEECNEPEAAETRDVS